MNASSGLGKIGFYIAYIVQACCFPHVPFLLYWIVAHIAPRRSGECGQHTRPTSRMRRGKKKVKRTALRQHMKHSDTHNKHTHNNVRRISENKRHTRGGHSELKWSDNMSSVLFGYWSSWMAVGFRPMHSGRMGFVHTHTHTEAATVRQLKHGAKDRYMFFKCIAWKIKHVNCEYYAFEYAP